MQARCRSTRPQRDWASLSFMTPTRTGSVVHLFQIAFKRERFHIPLVAAGAAALLPVSRHIHRILLCGLQWLVDTIEGHQTEISPARPNPRSFGGFRNVPKVKQE